MLHLGHAAVAFYYNLELKNTMAVIPMEVRQF